MPVPDDVRIGLGELQSKLAAGDIVLLDALSAEEYCSGHIPGALNLPPRRARRLAPLYVPDKSAEIVVYGANVASEAGRQLARRLRQLGYTNVRLFAGGSHKWIRFLLPIVASARCSAADQPAHRVDPRVDIAA